VKIPDSRDGADDSRPAGAGRALARKGRHGRKQPFDIMHKAIMCPDPTLLILGKPRRASKGSREVGGVVTRDCSRQAPTRVRGRAAKDAEE
jgi:hypothetical protein